MTTEGDTIVAFATSNGQTGGIGDGAIGIIRMSGPDAFKIAGRIYRGKKPFETLKPYTIGYGFIFECRAALGGPAAPGGKDRIIDEVLILKMAAPRSYTREDVVEIHCHAGAEVQRKILNLLMKSGARAAAPGEFTKRAFLNGRLDLSQAEAVMDLIRANSEIGASTAMRQLEGALSEKIRAVREQLIGLVASLEAFLDFPEHEVEEQSIDEIDDTLGSIEVMLRGLAESFEFGRVAREGALAVIIGRPNVGKSTLLNLFAGGERAIVTEIPGTTRDVIDEYKNIGGLTIRFLDTAGIRDTEDVVEKVGIARTLGTIEKADIALLLFGADEGFCSGDARLIELTKAMKRVFIINKTDIAQPGTIEAIRSELSDSGDVAVDGARDAAGDAAGDATRDIAREARGKTAANMYYIVEASLISGEGLADIEDAVRNTLIGQLSPGSGDAILTNARHNTLVLRGLKAVLAARETLNAGMPLELPIIDMREALAALGEITGEEFSEDIIDRIFSEFCVGK